MVSIIIDFLWAKPPPWFNNQTIKHTQNQIIGYGQARDYNEAKQSAIDDIAKMLQIDVDSTIIIDKNSSNKSYNKEVTQSIKTSSNVRLNGLKIIKQEKFNNIWFVAIFYDNQPLFQKIINYTNPKNKNSNSYLIKTKLFKLLHRHFGFYPNANIYALNGQYYINIENQSFLISQQEFIELFINSHNKNIKIEVKSRLKHKETYFITTRFKEFGFASLFLVANSGTVVTMFKNIELIDAKFTYPNKEKYNGLSAEIENNSQQSKEMFVALLCVKKEDIGLFNQVSTELEKESFRFGDLLDLMGRCAFSTEIITIFR
jgi:hypothetical protein